MRGPRLDELPDVVLERIARFVLHSDGNGSSTLSGAELLPVTDIPVDNVHALVAYNSTCRRMRASVSPILQYMDCTRVPFFRSDVERFSSVDPVYARLLPMAGPHLRQLVFQSSTVFDLAAAPEESRALRALFTRFTGLYSLRFTKCAGAEAFIVSLGGKLFRRSISVTPNHTFSGHCQRTCLPALELLTIESSSAALADDLSTWLFRALASSDVVLSSGCGETFPRLENLALQSFRGVSINALDDLCASDLARRITVLRLGPPKSAGLIDGAVVCDRIARSFTSLAFLELYMWMDGIASSKLCVDVGVRLEVLCLSLCEWTDAQFLTALKACPNVYHLTVAQCSGISADALVEALAPYPEGDGSTPTLKLKTFTLSGSQILLEDHVRKLSFLDTVRYSASLRAEEEHASRMISHTSPLLGLEKLSLSFFGRGDLGPSPTDYIPLVETCRETLECLEIRCRHVMEDGGLEFFACLRAIGLPKLQRLVLQWRGYTNGDALAAFTVEQEKQVGICSIKVLASLGTQ